MNFFIFQYWLYFYRNKKLHDKYEIETIKVDSAIVEWQLKALKTNYVFSTKCHFKICTTNEIEKALVKRNLICLPDRPSSKGKYEQNPLAGSQRRPEQPSVSEITLKSNTSLSITTEWNKKCRQNVFSCSELLCWTLWKDTRLNKDRRLVDKHNLEGIHGLRV